MKIYCFDLDGTILDSSNAILNSLNYACNRNGLNSFSESELAPYIGPPLISYLPKLLNIDKEDLILTNVISDFRFHHDNFGYKDYCLYPYTSEILFFLKNKSNKINIYAVTNKPFNISKKTLNFLNISRFFDGIYSIDSCTEEEINKDAKFKRSKENYLIKIQKRNLFSDKIFIGDTYSDYEATFNNEFKFIFASYGYGEISKFKKSFEIIRSLKDLESLL